MDTLLASADDDEEECAIVEQGDMIDGLHAAVEMFEKACQKRKYTKRVFLLTDGETKIAKREIRETAVVDALKSQNIKLNVIAFDFANESGETDKDGEQG